MSEHILQITTDLYSFVSDSEILLRDKVTAANARKFRDWAEDLRQRLDQSFDDVGARMGDEISRVRGTLLDFLEELRLQHPRHVRLKLYWEMLGQNYEALVLGLQDAKIARAEHVDIQHLKPRNYTRNIFHFFNSVWVVALCEFVLSPNGVKIFSVGMLAFAVSMEVLRRISSDWNRRFCETIFGPVARPHEFHSITAATWYTLALVIGVFTMPLQAIEAGALVLGAGDPVASIVGKRFGRRRIFGEKTLAGAFGFFVSACLILAIFLFSVMPSLGMVPLLLMTCAVALSGTVTELFSGPLEDNFTIPLVTGLVATLFMMWF